MRYLFSILTLVILVVSPAVAQNYTLNAFLKHDADIEGVAFSADGRTLASMGSNRILNYWDPHTEKSQPESEISAIDRWSIDASVVPEEPHTLPVNTFDTLRQAVSFPGVEDPNGLLATGSSDESIWLQGFPSLRPLFQIQEQGEVWAVALSPDGRTLASGGDFAGIHLWDLTTISPVHGTIELKSTLAASTARVEGLAFSPDGQTLAVATGKSDGEAIHLWDLRTEQRTETLIAVGVPIKKVAFSPDGQMIVGGASHYSNGHGRNVLLWKRGPLSAARIPNSVELAGPTTVRALAKDFTYTVTVKNVYGHGIENVLVRLDNPPTGVWTDNQPDGAWTDSQGNAVFFLQFQAVGMHDINVKVLHRASRAVTLENLFERRTEVPKPTSITPLKATLDYILICGSRTQGYYNDAFTVTDATGQPLENFAVHFFVYPDGTSPSNTSTVDASTDDQGQVGLEAAVISEGTYDVKAEVYDLVNTTPWLDGTFPNRVTAIQHQTVNQYGTTVYTHADGNMTFLIKGLTLEDVSDCEDDYTQFFPPADGDYFDLYNQGAPQNLFSDLLESKLSGNGCGLTSAMMVLNYYGVNVKPRSESISPEYRPEKLTVSEEHFVQRSLHNYVVENGEVFTLKWGIYPSEVQMALDRLLHSAHGPIQRFSGTRQDLIDVVMESRPPIIVWEVRAPEDWHYVVVVGYDTRNDSFLIADPNYFFLWLPWSWPGGEAMDITKARGIDRVVHSKPEDALVHSLQDMWGHFVDDDVGFAFIESDRWIRGLGAALVGESLNQYEIIVPSKAPQFHHLESETFRIELYGDDNANLFTLYQYDTKSESIPLNGKVHRWKASYALGARSKNTDVDIIDNDSKIRVTTEVKRGFSQEDDFLATLNNQHLLIRLLHGIPGIFESVLVTGYEDVYVTVYYEPDAPTAPVAPVLAAAPLQGNALLPNYPNPFNPETWIPYQLAKPSEVTLYIHGVDGKLVRKLALGHQVAGVYHSKARAAYWDGRNAQGERVASGLYFYTLITDDFHATGKMLILK